MEIKRVSGMWFAVLTLLGTGAVQAAEVAAERATPVASAGSAVIKTSVGKVAPKTVGTTGAMINKAGDSSIPSGSIPIPPKPKKEGLEAAGAIKAKAAQP